ncbi:MAG: hypothetical protein ACYC9S_13770 [Leptospirales bacterium]
MIHLQTSKSPAITTARECRGGVFLPFSKLPKGKPDETIFVTENQWGKVTLKRCRLTQTHQNILEAILVNAEKLQEAPDGRIGVRYSPGKVLRYLGLKTNNYDWLYDQLDDMHSTIIEIETREWRAKGSIIYMTHESKSGMGRMIPGKDGQRAEAHFQTVIFHPFFKHLRMVDAVVHYQALIPEILGLRHAATQALVRFCLSHDQVNMALVNLLTALGAIKGDTPERTRRYVAKKVRDEAVALKSDFGIEIRKMEDGREGVFYRKHPKVWFESPKPFPEPVLPEIDTGEPCSTTRGNYMGPNSE